MEPFVNNAPTLVKLVTLQTEHAQLVLILNIEISPKIVNALVDSMIQDQLIVQLAQELA